jgi:hypothetical protein
MWHREKLPVRGQSWNLEDDVEMNVGGREMYVVDMDCDAKYLL